VFLCQVDRVLFGNTQEVSQLMQEIDGNGMIADDDFLGYILEQGLFE